MSEPSVTFHDGVAVIRLGDGENRFARRFLHAFDRSLDEALARPETQALVTCGSDRFYCNGYDLEWLARESLEGRRAFIRDQQRLLARILGCQVPTVAAVTGHAFGAGALLALAHDVRMLREDYGNLCMPEIDARIPLRRAMCALLEMRLAPTALRDVVLTGRRFGGEAAVAAGLVREVASADHLLARAIEVATDSSGKDRRTLGSLKRAAYAEALAGLAPESSE
jgi:enoyl-CoA hydratase/carnithine racemase